MDIYRSCDNIGIIKDPMSEKHKEKIKQLNLRKPKSRKIKNVKM